MGVVYLAEQTEPIRRRVALKVIKRGMDTKQVLARLESERQALALMNHPNVAKLLDAGTTEAGLPYFVMEHVHGVPITDYCDRHRLSTPERLVLFMQVCQAVQHAHRKGIIHRDIKPSNVLVALVDDIPAPKVIDFGVAKATQQRLTERTLFTEQGQMVGTPEYMSPEQAEMSDLDIDTRSDIYSLGVLLYELLTGTTPFDPATFRQAAYGEIQRIIREEEPPKPSTRIDTLARSGTGVGTAQATDAGHLSRVMRGDLDWIVMKALEKDRTRRYQTANEFTADILRYLKGEPVFAGPPSVIYKFRKFVTRHRLGVTAAGLITAAILTGLSMATVGLVQARREADRSQRIADFLQDLLVSTDADAALAEGTDVAGVLATARETFGDDHATVAAILSSRATQLQSAGDLQGAEELYHESLHIWRSRFGDDNPHVGTTLGKLGTVLMRKGDEDAAEEALRESIAIIAGDSPGIPALMACEPMGTLASLLANKGQFAEAESLLRECVRIRRAKAPQQRLELALTTSALVNIVYMGGDPAAAQEAMPEVLEAWRAAVPPQSSFLARILAELGTWSLQLERDDAAEPLLREALDIYRAANDPAHRHYTLALRGLAKILENRDAPGEALPFCIQAIKIARDFEGDRVLDSAVTDLARLAWQVARASDLPAAQYLLAHEGMEICLAEKPDESAYINTLGILKYRLGEYEASLETLARSHSYYSQEHAGGVPADLAFIAMAQHRLGRETEALTTMVALRTAMANPELRDVEDNRKHLAEADALLGGEQDNLAAPNP